jgi:hypothetical protein
VQDEYFTAPSPTEADDDLSEVEDPIDDGHLSDPGTVSRSLGMQIVLKRKQDLEARERRYVAQSGP